MPIEANTIETIDSVETVQPITVSSSVSMTDTTLGNVKAIGVSQLDLKHGNVGELTLKLTHNTSEVILLQTPDTTAAKPEGCVGKDFDGTEISDNGLTNVQNSCKTAQPAYGTTDFTPKNSLSAFTGEKIEGEWTLTVIDSNKYGSGQLNKWCLQYTVESQATINLSPASGQTLNFGSDVVVNVESSAQEITLVETTNSFSLVVEKAEFTGTHKDNFKLTSHHITNDFAMIIAPGTTQTYKIACTPSGRGTRSATFNLYTNLPTPNDKLTYDLTCKGVGAEYNDHGAAGPINFGNIDLGATSSQQTITISENGDAGHHLEIKSIELSGTNSSDFEISGKPTSFPHLINQGSGNTLALGITCKPTEIGDLTAKLRIKTNDVANATNDYNLKCAGMGPIYESFPVPDSTINFGQNGLGNTSKRNITVKNDGNKTLTIESVSFAAHADVFSLSITLGLDISAGSIGALPITCASDTAGTYSTQIEVTHNGANSPTKYQVTCETATDTIPEYSSTPLINGTITIGSAVNVGESTEGNLYIYEIGTDALTIDLAEPALSGTDVSAFSIISPTFPITMADGSTATTVKIQCAPTHKGTHTATLNLAHNGKTAQNPASYKLTCEGKAPIYRTIKIGDVTTDSVGGKVDIGEVVVGETITKSYKVKNSGDARLEVTNMNISGAHASDFAITNPSSGKYGRNANNTQTVELKCTPKSINKRTATLTATTNDPASPTVTYDLECTGKRPIGAGYYSEPSANSLVESGKDIGEIKFGAIRVDSTIDKTLTISEQGTAVLKVYQGSTFISGANAADFQVTDDLASVFNQSDNGFHITDDSGEKITLHLTCKPSAVGERVAYLNLKSNDSVFPNLTYKMTCEGIAPPVIEEPDDKPDDIAKGDSNDTTGNATVTPSRVEQKLTIQFEGNGFGTVTVLPNKIACSNYGAYEQCENRYAQNSTLQLQATASNHAYFVGWSNGCHSETFVLDSDKTCVATFERLPQYSLNVEIVGAGIVNAAQYPDFNCQLEQCVINDLLQDSTVNLQPTASEGWLFTGWEGDCTSDGQVTITANKTCRAIFITQSAAQANVKFSVGIRVGNGVVQSDSGLNCHNNVGLCAGDYAPNTIINIVAIPDAAYVFSGWMGDCVHAGNSTSHSLQLTKPETHCMADFKIPLPSILPAQPNIPHEPEPPTEINKPEVDTSEEVDTPEVDASTETPKIICLTEGRLNYACDAEGQTVQKLTILATGSISNTIIEGEIDNQGWVSSSTVKSTGKISGGILTGQTIVEEGGVLENITLRGDLIDGGTLRGDIRNESSVSGIIQNVHLAPKSKITGGYIAGTINGDANSTCRPTARLENLVVLAETVLNHVVIGEAVKFAHGVEFGDCVIVADGKVYRPDQDKMDENGIIHLAKNSYVSNGELNGNFIGNKDGLPLLENVTIGKNSTVDNVILGHDIVNLGEVTNFELRGIHFTGGTIGGEINALRGGTIKNVTLQPNTKINGGNFTGKIKGNPDAPATISNGFITANACISNVILAEGTAIADGACIGDNVINQVSEQQHQATPEIEAMLQVNPNGQLIGTDATFDPRVAICDIPRTNNTLLSKRDAKSVELQAYIGVDPIHQGLAGEMLMVMRHNFNGTISDMMKLPDDSWTEWHDGMNIVAFQTFDALPAGIDTLVFKGDFGKVRGEIIVFMGYRLTDGTIVYNGGEPLRVFIDTTPDTCLVYAIHDEGLNETQPVIIDLSVGLDGDMRLLGTERTFYGYDIEGMELHPDDDNLLLGTAGDDANIYGKEQDAHLYTINKTTGKINKVGQIASSDGSIKFEQVAGIALHPVTKQLWGWGIVNSKNKFMAIIHIDHTTGIAQIHKQFEHNQANNVTGLTWSYDGKVMFMSSEDRLWRYNPNTQQMKVTCEGISDQVVNFLKARNDVAQLKLIGYKKGEIEGLDIQPNGWLLIGIDYQASTASSIVAYDAETCQVKQIQTFRNSVFHDLESVVWPTKACNDQSWLNEDPCAEFNK